MCATRLTKKISVTIDWEISSSAHANQSAVSNCRVHVLNTVYQIRTKFSYFFDKVTKLEIKEELKKIPA